MRLKEDSTSWKARGIKRRDFRHTHGEPEIDASKIKKKTKARRRIDHKHAWLLDPNWPRDLSWYYAPGPQYPTSTIRHICAVEGCDAVKYTPNPRFGYERMKWEKLREREKVLNRV